MGIKKFLKKESEEAEERVGGVGRPAPITQPDAPGKDAGSTV